ncbi:MAG: hypothetical protein E7056_01315 [Lentisphaerae bacterium]|nr:hypothetical protein [Lentisphaerota bacterium]
MTFKSTIRITLYAALLLPQMLGAAPRDLGAFSNVRTSAARLPFYQNGHLEYYMRSQSMVIRGKNIETTWPIIDAVRKGVSVEMIARSDSSSEFYKLGTPVAEVAKYWLNRAYSDGLIISESAVLDQIAKVASGKQKVFLRSPMLDLDGVGFTADFNRSLVTVNSNVQIVLRGDGERSLGGALKGVDGKKESAAPDGKKKSDSMTYVYCNELNIDGKRNVITLLGKVRVFDPAGTVTSDRLELELEESKKSADGKEKSADDRSGGSRRLKSARFIGNVHAVRKLDAEEAARGEQFADADMAVYTAADDVLELTGSRPRLSRGKDFAEAERIVVMPEKKVIKFFDKCLFKFRRDEQSAKADSKDKETPMDVVTSDYADFDQAANLIRLIGNVRMQSPADNTDMSADQLEIVLQDEKTPEDKKESPQGDKKNSPLGGGQVKTVSAIGKVKLLRKSNGSTEQAQAGRMVYTAASDELALTENPVLQRDDDLIRGGKMLYKVNEERLLVDDRSHIVLSAATVGSNSSAAGGIAVGGGKGTANGEPVTVDSVSSDLNYGGNLITFNENVKVRGRGMLLDCEKLDIFLKDAPKSKKTAAKSEADKSPTRALAVGKVHAEDKTGSLDCSQLDIYFGDKAVPGKTDVEKILANGKVHIKSKPEEPVADSSNMMVGPQPKKKSKNSTLLGSSADGTTSLDAERGEIDLLADTADFYENVVVKDSASTLECDHLKATARKTAGSVPSLESYRKRDEFPDRLAVGEDRELVRINANGNVRMTRVQEDGEKQKAKSDYAVYEVQKRTVVMTSDPPGRPQAVTADSGMIGDKVTIELDTEDIHVENGDILTRMNN